MRDDGGPAQHHEDARKREQGRLILKDKVNQYRQEGRRVADEHHAGRDALVVEGEIQDPKCAPNAKPDAIPTYSALPAGKLSPRTSAAGRWPANLSKQRQKAPARARLPAIRIITAAD